MARRLTPDHPAARPSRVPPTIRRVRADEGLRLRALRLRALATAPHAFSATLAEEQAFPEEVWHGRAARGAAGIEGVTFVAEDGDRWIGMVTGLAAGPDAPGPALVGMFVEPDARGRGLGGGLVRAVAAWARERGAPGLYLWVGEGNAAARALYARCGFRPTGRTKASTQVPPGPDLQMVLGL
jgi:GNAT superfamily N-acetyltransferase